MLCFQLGISSILCIFRSSPFFSISSLHGCLSQKSRSHQGHPHSFFLLVSPQMYPWRHLAYTLTMPSGPNLRKYLINWSVISKLIIIESGVLCYLWSYLPSHVERTSIEFWGTFPESVSTVNLILSLIPFILKSVKIATVGALWKFSILSPTLSQVL